MDAYQEVEITFDGRKFRLRPTFQAIVQIEAATSQAARALGRRCALGDMPIGDMATCLFVLLRDKGGPKTRDEVGDILIWEGNTDLIEPLGQFFLDALKGTDAHMKEAAARAAVGNPQTVDSSPKGG